MAQQISNREFLAIRLLSIVFAILFLVSVALEVVNAMRRSAPAGQIVFAAHDFSPRLALFHVLSLFLCIAILRANAFLIASLVGCLYAVLFTLSAYLTLNGEGALGGLGFYDDKTIWQEISNKAHGFDYVAAIFLTILIPWISSIQVRRARFRFE